MNARQIETALTALMYARFNHEDYWRTWAGGERPSTQLELIDESVKALETLRAQLHPAPEGMTPARLRAALRTLVDLHAVGDESAARDVVRAWLATHHPTP